MIPCASSLSTPAWLFLIKSLRLNVERALAISYPNYTSGRWYHKGGKECVRFIKEANTRQEEQALFIGKRGLIRVELTYWVVLSFAEATNSIFRWYRNVAKYYVFLLDISLPSIYIGGKYDKFSANNIRTSKWFKLDWNSRSLLAPMSIELFSEDRKF
jgi:hypothetical protein